MSSVKAYFRELVARLGAGWNQFWFRPTEPLSLCVLRAAVGLLAVIWWIQLGTARLELFGPQGILPVASMTPEGEDQPFSISISLLDLATDDSTVHVVYWVGLAVLINFALGIASDRSGWLDRLSSGAALVFVVSVLHRKRMVATPFEDVLPMPMLYLTIAPNAAMCSVAAWFRARLRPRDGVAPQSPVSYTATIATRLIQIHVAVIYAMMVLAMLRIDVWWQGTAIWWMSANPQARLIDVKELLPEYALNAWTHAIVLFELFFPVLIWNRLARPLLLALSVFVWGGICLASGQVLFSLLMVVLGIAFLSPTWLRSCCQRD